MASLTLKNVPDELLKALREAAAGDRRSLNQEVIHILSESLDRKMKVKDQLDAWEKLAGLWQSDLSPEEEGKQIMDARTGGREVDL